VAKFYAFNIFDAQTQTNQEVKGEIVCSQNKSIGSYAIRESFDQLKD